MSKLDKEAALRKPYKLNLPVFVKRVRKAMDAKTIDVLTDKFDNEAGCFYSVDGRTCVIGAGLPATVVSKIVAQDFNDSTLSTLIEHNFVSIDEKFKDRLIRLQKAHDEGDAKAMRSRFRHLEASVKKKYPASFAA